MPACSLWTRLARLGAVVAAAAWPLVAGAAPTGAAEVARIADRSVLPFAVLQGQPDMSAGQGMGYWLWHDDDGIHLRTTTRGREHIFSGVLRTGENAQFTDVQEVRLDHRHHNQDGVVTSDDGRTIRFHFHTWDGTDGIDFRLDGRALCVDLANNGHEAVASVHLGRFEVMPSDLPVCFRRQEQ
jgi:hypothetical protein